MYKRFIYISKAKRENLLFFSMFFFASAIGASYSYFNGSIINNIDQESIFNPVIDFDSRDFWHLLSNSFYDDAFDSLYVFISSFLFVGRFVCIGYSLLRGARYGYYFLSLINTRTYLNTTVFDPDIFILLLSDFIVNFIMLIFFGEAWRFYGKLRRYYNKKLEIFKTKSFLMYSLSAVLVCGILAFVRLLCTLLIIIF